MSVLKVPYADKAEAKALGARWVVVGSYAVDMRGRMRVDARAVGERCGAIAARRGAASSCRQRGR